MDIESYWMFVVSCIILCLIPGPDMIYLLSRSIAQGKKAGFAAALGINAGGYFHLFASVIGISAVIATSSMAFTILKWCGALYLFYIGIQALLSNNVISQENHNKLGSLDTKAIFWQGFISDVLNPKVAIFFISLLPQFISPSSGGVTTQLLILGLTVNFIALSINLIIILMANSVTKQIRDNGYVSSVLNKCMGFVFIGLSVKLVNESR